MTNRKITIQKNSIQETLIIPLYTRKRCNELYPNLFQDKSAEFLIDQMDYDFSEIREKSNSTMARFGALEIAMRQQDMAIEVRAYLKEHPKAAVVNLGCGLDQTAENCDNGTCNIYNLDFPDVIAIRNELCGERERVKNLAVDLNDHSWFDMIDATDGVIFMAAGVFYYFKKNEIQALFQNMASHFPGGVLVFDAAGKRAVKIMVNKVVQKMGIQDVDAFFHVDHIDRDIKPWLSSAQVTSKGYMLGYNDLKDPSVSGLFRFMAKLGDGVMKMQIVRVAF